LTFAGVLHYDKGHVYHDSIDTQNKAFDIIMLLVYFSTDTSKELLLQDDTIGT